MNERIRELAEQADFNHWHKRWYSGINPRVMDPEIQKFVELILQDCIRLAGPEDSYRDEWFNAKCDSVAKIKNYFRVE
jgi:hypothetical protein